ncbi:flagellar motor switch protein FliG [Thermodesulfitimonas autotrophica]|uniref:Flagellar motor switch protein FliG n=1 Tax=Thermodesulfitimonas autotrophica TaxID=1894989 RepID=A0A3N5AE35_9THEO|nr:flagellar motor switch protein FliG [Thermodesulfitimonas autotrophica]RPF42917.1 flagellar motor switch protein FliG [Thermodesulfitimonas autotrophica]
MAQPKLKGRQKAAVLLLTLGADLSAKVLKQHFPESEIERLTYTISNLGRVPPEVRDSVLDEFLELKQVRAQLIQGGVKNAREILEKVVGPQKAEEIIRRLTQSAAIIPFASLRKTDPKHLLSFLRDEHPQTIALVLSYLEPSQAGAILSSLPQEMQVDIVKRIATMERTSPEIVHEIQRVLEHKMMTVVSVEQTQAGGIESLVGILNMVDRATEKSILESLENEDPALADEVRKRMFMFEDIVKLDDVSIQRVLREVNTKDLAVALRGATEEVKNRIFKNMSQRAAKMLKDELDFMGPVRLKQVEEAQQKIVKVIRALEDSGEIVIARGGEDALIL